MLVAVGSWALPATTAVQGAPFGRLAFPLTTAAIAVVCALLWRRARRTPEESPLWLGLLGSWALLSLCVPLHAVLTQPLGRRTALLLALVTTTVVVVGYLVQHAGLNAWHRRWVSQDTTDSPAGRAAPATAAAPAPVPTAVDRYEVLLGLAAVLLSLALLNVAVLLLPRVVGPGDPLLAWAVLQPTLALVAVSFVRTMSVPAAAHARGVLGDGRMWLLVASAVLLGAAGATDALDGGLRAQVTLAPVALLLQAAATLLRPSRQSRRPVTSQVAATQGSFVVLMLSVGVLAAGAVGHAMAEEWTAVPAPLAPFGTAPVLLCLVAAALTGSRLLLNLRHLAWWLASQHEALTDELTGLVNRRGLLRRLERACAEGGCIGLALVDVDHFKAVNDGLGHVAGDELLRQVGQRLRSAGRTFPYERVIARLGGDEFAVLVLPADRDIPVDVLADGSAQAAAWAVSLRQLFAEPFELAGVQVHVRASIGLTTLDPAPAALATGEADHRPSELLRRVDAAMLAAKRDEQRGRAVVYDPVRHDEATRELRTVAQLRHGLEAGEVVPRYQPQVDVATGVATGVEALARWEHPTRGTLGPDDFLPLAEAHGLMHRLTDVVLEQALGQLAAWRSSREPAAQALRMSVNLSATSLLDAQLPARVADLLHAHQVPPHLLVLEVTETVLLRDPERSTAVVAALRDLGVELSIDDFGTGYSSLTQLRMLPVDELKLDRAFTTGLGTDPRAAHIVASTVSLAHGLGMRVVAEGVEDEATLARLVELGCDVTQGYLHARPLTAADLGTWLRHHGPVAALPHARRPRDDG